MKKEDIFEKASKYYSDLVDVCDEFFENIVKKYFPQTPKDGLFAQLDIYLQSLLIGIGCSDKDLNEEELIFIEQLTKFGNIFDSINGGIKAFNNADLNQINALRNMAIKNSKNIPLLLQIIAKLDSQIKEVDYTELILKGIFNIMVCLTVFDEKAKKEETQFAVELITPLIQLFPRVNVKAFFQKSKDERK